VGKAQRAHHETTWSAVDGGYVAFAPLPTRHGKSLLIFRNRVKVVIQKYSAFVLTQISRITPPVSPDERALANVTNAR